VRRRLMVVLAAGLMVTLVACGSDDSSSDESGSSTASGTAPEERRASDEEVAAGLTEIASVADATAQAVADGADDAATLNEGIEAAWQPVEGTVLANDEDAYITFEDNFALLGAAVEDSDAAQAEEANTAIAAAVEDYLAAYPG
jgi:hypothetical protein